MSEALPSHFSDEDIEARGGMTCPRSQVIVEKQGWNLTLTPMWHSVGNSHPSPPATPPVGELASTGQNLIQSPHVPSARSQSPRGQVSLHSPAPRALAKVAHRPGCQRFGAGWCPGSAHPKRDKSTGVRGTLRGRAGVELAPPYLPPPLAPEPAGWKGEDIGRHPASSPHSTLGIRSRLIKPGVLRPRL